jgi:hypothetical protein
VLKDVSGAVIDEMVYEVFAMTGSADSENWIANALTVGCIPGLPNEARLATSDLSVMVRPDPFDE